MRMREKMKSPLLTTSVSIEDRDTLVFPLHLEEPSSNLLLLSIVSTVVNDNGKFFDGLVRYEVLVSICSTEGKLVWKEKYNKDGKVDSFWGNPLLLNGKPKMVAALRIGCPVLNKGDYSFSVRFANKITDEMKTRMLVSLRAVDETSLVLIYSSIAKAMVTAFLMVSMLIAAVVKWRTITKGKAAASRARS